MQLTAHTDYALRLLIYLAARDESMPATVEAVATRYRVSTNHMSKVAQTLVAHGHIESRRGRSGGLVLAQSPESINVGALVRETENLRLLDCFGPESTCPIEPACRLKRILGTAQAAFLSVLDDYTLADLATNDSQLRALLSLV